MLNNELDNVRLEEICTAAFEGKIDVLQNLLENNFDLNKNGRNWTPLQSAIENHNTECVKLLIEKGADVEYCGTVSMSPLEHAIHGSIDSNNNTGGKEGDERTDIISILLAAGADPASGLKAANSYQTQKILAILQAYKK